MEMSMYQTQSDAPSADQQYFALTAEGSILILPPAEYASGALHKYRAECEAAGRETPNFPMIFNEHQYRSVLSAVAAELSDVDGNDLVPKYVVFPYSSQQAVFPHSSVDTEEEIAEFIATYPLEVAGPVLLSVVQDNWPQLPEPAVPEPQPPA